MKSVVEVLTVAVTLGCCASAVTATIEQRLVYTEDGTISGFKEHSTKGRSFYTFHSIPYAKPPVNDLRFKDPVAGEGWTGVRDGTKLPPLCPQIPFLALTKKQLVLEGDEDCLYLSLFSPMPAETESRLPVMVFFHGGGFFSGGIIKYNGNVMMNEDVILVLVQYRLGILGFMSTEDSVMPGNYGLKDQTLALRWVHNNIHHFGGDPGKVTLFGESAGGASVHFHLLSPHSKDLFARGIMMSGTLFSPWAMGGAFREVAKYTARVFDCPQPADSPECPASEKLLKCVDDGRAQSEAMMRCLQGVDANNITSTLKDHAVFAFNPVLVGPRVDGDYLPAEPELLMKEGRHKDTNIISGVTANEGGLLALPLYEMEELRSHLMNDFEEYGPGSLDLRVNDEEPQVLAHKIFEHYLGSVSVAKEDADDVCQLFGDRHFTVGHDLVSALYARNAAPHKAYLYSVDHHGQRSFHHFYDVDVGEKWVTHADDLFYIFSDEPLEREDDLQRPPTIWKPLEREDDLKLRDIITKLFVNFAASGNPTPDDSLGFRWAAAAPDNLQHLSLTPTPAMVGDNRRQIRAFWATLPTRQNMILNPDKVVHILADNTSAKHHRQLLNDTIKLRKWISRDEL